MPIRNYLLPLLALLGIGAGLLLVCYGYLFHETTVAVRSKQAAAKPGPPTRAEPPPEPLLGEELFLPGLDFPGDWMSPPAPAPEPAAPAEPAEEAITVTEWDLVRDATVGGIVRLADGRLSRTYVGKPPSACPT